MKVLVVGQGQETVTWLQKIATVLYVDTAEFIEKKQLFLLESGIDAVVLTGGADIEPEWYDQHKHGRTRCSNGERENWEYDLFEEAQVRDIPCVGICRGSQYLAVLNGGELYQDVDAHTHSHDIEFEDGSRVYATSTHHQMFNYDAFENKDDIELIAWCKGRVKSAQSMSGLKENKITVHHGGYVTEPEIYKFKSTNTLCIQGHPEFKHATNKFSEVCLNLIEKLIKESKES